jgi:sugar lactone lactonase YvrE
VWRIPRGGSAQIWDQDPSLAGTGALGLGFPLGANGIAYQGHSFVVTNTEVGSLVRIPLRPDGGPGNPEVFEDPAFFGADGLAVDVHGDIYVAVIAQSTIVRVHGATITTIADASDGINEASSLAFGTGNGERQNLFAVNFGPFTSTPTPAILRIPVGVPGAPLP